jgi:hypothetical protein
MGRSKSGGVEDLIDEEAAVAGRIRSDRLQDRRG